MNTETKKAVAIAIEDKLEAHLEKIQNLLSQKMMSRKQANELIKEAISLLQPIIYH
jgi:hypothetical protein